MEQNVERVNVKSNASKKLLKMEVFLHILNVIVLLFVITNVVKPFVEDDTLMTHFEENMQFIWNNGLQIECVDITFEEGVKTSLNDLVNKPLYAPENADVNFRLRLDDHTVAIREGNVISVNNYGVKDYIFDFENNIARVDVDYVLLVFVGVACYIFAYIFELLLIILILVVKRKLESYKR